MSFQSSRGFSYCFSPTDSSYLNKETLLIETVTEIINNLIYTRDEFGYELAFVSMVNAGFEFPEYLSRKRPSYEEIITFTENVFALIPNVKWDAELIADAMFADPHYVTTQLRRFIKEM